MMSHATFASGEWENSEKMTPVEMLSGKESDERQDFFKFPDFSLTLFYQASGNRQKAKSGNLQDKILIRFSPDDARYTRFSGDFPDDDSSQKGNFCLHPDI